MHHHHVSINLSEIQHVHLVEEQNEVQGKCEEQSQETQVVEVSGEVVLQKRGKQFLSD